MSDLRVMEIPENKLGLGEGAWLRWEELRTWLLTEGRRDLVDLIEKTLAEGEDVAPREIRLGPGAAR